MNHRIFNSIIFVLNENLFRIYLLMKNKVIKIRHATKSKGREEMKVEHKCCTHNFNDHVGFQVFIVCHTYFDNFGCTIAIALVTAIHSLSTSLLYHYYGLFSSWHAFGPFQPLFQPHSTKPTKAEFSYQSTRTQWLKITEKVSFNIASEASYVYID